MEPWIWLLLGFSNALTLTLTIALPRWWRAKKRKRMAARARRTKPTPSKAKTWRPPKQAEQAAISPWVGPARAKQLSQPVIDATSMDGWLADEQRQLAAAAYEELADDRPASEKYNVTRMSNEEYLAQRRQDIA